MKTQIYKSAEYSALISQVVSNFSKADDDCPCNDQLLQKLSQTLKDMEHEGIYKITPTVIRRDFVDQDGQKWRAKLELVFSFEKSQNIEPSKPL